MGDEMQKVERTKEKALAAVKAAAKQQSNTHTKVETLQTQSKEEKKELKTDHVEIAKLKAELKEANSGTAGETLLSGMYQALPYEAACGSLAEDPAKIRTVVTKNKGACAARCAEISHCKAFQFGGKSCVLSKKQILKSSKFGEVLACATKNVLIKPNMKVGSSVYQKRAKKEEALLLFELGESYGFETPDEMAARKAQEKAKTKKADKDALQKVKSTPDEGKFTEIQKKLTHAGKELDACKVAQKAAASSTCEKDLKTCKAQAADYKNKLGAENSNQQE